jgi:hypothetical protein
VLPTSGNLIRPNQPKNSAADAKIRPLTLSFKKDLFTMTFTLPEFISVFTSLVLPNNKGFYDKYTLKKVRPLFVKSTKNSAADFSGRSYFNGATFVFCGRNFGQLATLLLVGRNA